MADDTAISFVASVEKVSTLSDGGLRITLDIPENAIAQAALLMECKRAGIVLFVTCKTVEITKQDGSLATGAKRKSRRTTKEK